MTILVAIVLSPVFALVAIAGSSRDDRGTKTAHGQSAKNAKSKSLTNTEKGVAAGTAATAILKKQHDIGSGDDDNRPTVNKPAPPLPPNYYGGTTQGRPNDFSRGNSSSGKGYFGSGYDRSKRFP